MELKKMKININSRQIIFNVIVLFLMVGLFDVSSASFNQIQDLRHSDTYDFQKFEIDDIHYLGSVRCDLSYKTSFQLYQWNSSAFEAKQLVSFDLMSSIIQVFKYNEQTYFLSTGAEKMVVYQWNQGNFIEYQQLAIPTTLYKSVLFYINNKPYVVISAIDGNLYIYEWNNSTGLQQKHSLSVEEAEVKFLQANGNAYLIAYEKSVTPKLFKWMGTKFSSSDDFMLPENNQYFASQFSYNSKEYFVFKNFGDYTFSDAYEYGVYQFDNQQFLEKHIEHLPSIAEILSFEINNTDFLVKTLSNRIEIFKWHNGSQKLYDTINCDNECSYANMFLMNHELYLATHYLGEYDPLNPPIEALAGIYVYKWEEKQGNLEDVICALKNVSGLPCNYQGPDIGFDGITGIEEVLYNFDVNLPELVD